MWSHRPHRKQSCHSFCPVDRNQLSTLLHLRPTESESCQQVLQATRTLRSTGPSYCFLLPRFMNSKETAGPSLVFCCPFDSHHAATYRKESGWQCWEGQHISLASDLWIAGVGLSVKRETSKCSGKWPAVTQPGPLRESPESWNPTPHPLCKASSHKAVNGGKGKIGRKTLWTNTAR